MKGNDVIARKRVMSVRQGFLLMLGVVMLHACSESPVDSTPGGTYAIVQYDSLGTQRAAGWIKLVITDSSHISGEWRLSKNGPPAPIGSESDGGSLVGETINGQTILNLHPSYVDNNLILIGTLRQSRYTGIWQWITFAGVSDQGTFQAQKR